MTAGYFEPNYQHFVDAVLNHKPQRLPLYEHIISPVIMERILNISFADKSQGSCEDVNIFFRHYCRFFREMTYDTVSFEVCVTDLLPGHGAIKGLRPGPIQNRRDLESYPWQTIAGQYWSFADRQFAALAETLPDGMKAVGGVGNGIFEIVEDLVGYEYLAYMQMDDPELFGQVFVKAGDLLAELWKQFLNVYGDSYAVCRFGDDLGFKSGLLVSTSVIHQHILPQYKRIIELIQQRQKPFLWHSCGCIFDIMDDVIALGINAKHSNEDQIASFERWIDTYSNHIGLMGGFDVDILCCKNPSDIFEEVYRKGSLFRRKANGYALGSGNSIPDYVPVEGYLAMVHAAKAIRENEKS